MATRMQQRRGTASQWTTADPILAAGEIGYETDTNKFKIGDGVNTWSDLDYFAAFDTALLAIVDGAPTALDTLNELAAALGDDANYAATITTALGNKADEVTKTVTEWLADTSIIPFGTLAFATDPDVEDHLIKVGNGVNTFADLSKIIKQDAMNSYVAAEISPLVIDIQGLQADISSKADIAGPTFSGTVVLPSTTSVGNVSSDEIGYLNGVTSAIQTQLDDKADAATVSTTYAPINTPTFTGTVTLPQDTAIGGITSVELGILDGLTVTTSELNTLDGITASTAELNLLDGVTATTTEINYVDGVTSAIQTQLDAKAPTANPTFTGTVNAASITLSGDLTVGGTTTTVNAQDLVVSDPLIYIGEGNTANVVDLGLVSSFDNGAYQHAGIVRDATDGVWKLFSSVEDEPTTTVNFSQAVYDTLKVGGIEYSDGTQVKQGVPSITTINQQAGSYTTVLADRDKLVEVSNASGVTVTIPLNSSVAYPVGTSIDILQTGAGQVTIAGAAGVTVNATPGLKLRTQWSSATLFKRATDTWVVFGDLSA